MGESTISRWTWERFGEAFLLGAPLNSDPARSLNQGAKDGMAKSIEERRNDLLPEAPKFS